MASPEPIDTSKWEEVKSINNYALFMAYMSLAIKGLGYLVILWTTVILLGGFVSVLGKKDFWCLTIITLLQIGISNVFLNVNIQKYIGRSLKGFLSVTNAVVAAMKGRNQDDGRTKLLVVTAVVWRLVQWLVLGVIMCPVVVFYMFGMLTTTSLAVWRLRKRDYGEVDGSSNLHPSLNVVYSIVLFQTVVITYRDLMMIFSQRKGLVATVVIDKYGLKHTSRFSVVAYLDETLMGCSKDPSFVEGRNLVSYAVELTKSGSPEDFLSGARILATLLDKPELSEQHKMIKLLLVSASSTEVLHKLLDMLDCTRPNDAETRECATTIVAHLAGSLRLQHFLTLRGINCIASLLEGPREEEEELEEEEEEEKKYDDDYGSLYFLYKNDDNGSCFPINYKKLIQHGLLILAKLAADEDCRQAIIHTEGLLAKIMAPLRSDLLHLNGHNDAWSSTVEASMEVMCRLVTSPACKDSEELRSIYSEMMWSIYRILHCKECSDLLVMQTLEIYVQLSDQYTFSNLEGTERSLFSETKRDEFINNLVAIFTKLSRGRSHIRELAGEKLATLSFDGNDNARIILQAKKGVIADLTQILVQDESIKCKIRAAQILEQLCIHHTDDNEYLKNLKEALLEVGMSEALAGTLADHMASSNLLATVLSLGATMLSNDFIHAEDLVRVFDKITGSFPGMLELMVTRNSKPTVSCLKTMKLTTEIFMLMVRNGGRYRKEDTDSLMESLSDAAKIMSDIEGVMVLSGRTSGTRNLGSLVNEAKEELMRIENAPGMEVV